MDIDTLQGLRRCPLFNGLTESEIIDLMHTVRYRVVRCCKGEFHAIEGSVCQYAHYSGRDGGKHDGSLWTYYQGGSSSVGETSCPSLFLCFR